MNGATCPPSASPTPARAPAQHRARIQPVRRPPRRRRRPSPGVHRARGRLPTKLTSDAAAAAGVWTSSPAGPTTRAHVPGWRTTTARRALRARRAGSTPTASSSIRSSADAPHESVRWPRRRSHPAGDPPSLLRGRSQGWMTVVDDDGEPIFTLHRSGSTSRGLAWTAPVAVRREAGVSTAWRAGCRRTSQNSTTARAAPDHRARQ
jgi:hypothetical protein